jgi:D-lactate dehydrogenase (cytochrome)
VPGHSIRAREARGSAVASVRRDPDLLAGVLEDAAHFPGGHADGVITVVTEADIARILRCSQAVLAIGSQSSLTGGATPMGDVVIVTSRLNQVHAEGDDWIRVGAGTTLTALDERLRATGRYYPPAPTFMGASVGGIVATNAAGAATFKYGATRDWIRALTVVLPSGEALDVERGTTIVHPDGYFEVVSTDRTALRIPMPTYLMPRVPKVSAGYFAAPGMDLIDLFIGSEGTLGVVTEVTLTVVPERPAMCLAFVPFTSRVEALRLVERLRQLSRETWKSRDPQGLDISAIEHLDRRCLALAHEDGADARFGVQIPSDTAMALLVTVELPPGTRPDQAFDEIGRFRELTTPLARFCRILDDAGVLDAVEIAVPGDERRAVQLRDLREAVPAAVNARVGRAKETIDRRIAKTAGDIIVPFERLDELMRIYDEEFERRGLDGAVWGHISDGNLHPNVIPRSLAELESGKEAIRRFGLEAIRLGGSPLAEHGVGRNPIKQEMLKALYGADGITEMRAVKQALDPEFKLARGVLFEPA